MKYLLVILTLAFTINANAQTIAVGSDAVQVGASSESVFAQATYKSDIVWNFKTKLSVGVGVFNESTKSYTTNGNTERFNGYTEQSANVAFMPSAMVGLDIPIHSLTFGVYSGFRSYNSNAFFEPVSISITF